MPSLVEISTVVLEKKTTLNVVNEFSLLRYTSAWIKGRVALFEKQNKKTLMLILCRQADTQWKSSFRYLAQVNYKHVNMYEYVAPLPSQLILSTGSASLLIGLFQIMFSNTPFFSLSNI